jgi:hypothetical protein
VLESAAVAYDFPTPLHAEFWRKVRTLGGLYQTLRLYPRLLGPSNRMWLHFCSHKLGRILLPYALVAAMASSFFLPEPWRAMAIWAQGAFYATALLDLLLPQRFFLKRVTSPIRTFVVLMAASACAVSIFFVSPRLLWKTPSPRPAAPVS